jgi:hypothetical protein
VCWRRPKSYLLVLLTLKAYQQHIAAAAAGTGSANSSAGSGHDEAVALGCILQNFLRLAAQLSSSTLLSWEVQYDRDTVQQVLTRPELAAALRPKGCEQHPIILDPSCPTNNVAAAVADLSRLKQLAAADLDKVEGSRIALLEQQLQCLQQEQQATVQKLQQEHNAAVQQQSKQLAALLLHQRVIGFGSSQTFRWEVSMPVSKWLPGATEEVVSGPFQWNLLPDLWLQMVNKPYSATAYGSDHLAGFTVQLAAGKSPEMTSLSELKLPIPFTVLARSTLTLEAVKDSRGYTTHSERTTQMDADAPGSINGLNGALVVFKRSSLHRLDLVHPYKEYDATQLEGNRNRTLKFSLEFKFNG